MITLHPPTTPTTQPPTNNGLAVLDRNIINPLVTEELNGNYQLSFDYPLAAAHSSEIQVGCLISCPVPNGNRQWFRIHHQTTDEHHTLHASAAHVFYDLAANIIMDANLVNLDANQALSRIMSSTQFEHGFRASTDLYTRASARLVRVSVAQVLLSADLDNGFLARWGGEISRDNTSIMFYTRLGYNTDIEIRVGKNITAITSTVDYSSVITRLVPVGFDGLMLREKWIDSPRINDYPTPRIGVIKFDHIKSRSTPNAKTAEDALPHRLAVRALKQAGQNKYTQDHIDQPARCWNVDFIDLATTKQYERLQGLASLSLGDSVRVIDEAAGVDVKARVTSYTYDPLTNGYTTLTLGSYTPKLSSQTASATQTANSAVTLALAAGSQIGAAKARAEQALTSADGKNRNYYGDQKPADPREGDTWFKPNGEKQEIWIYKKVGNSLDWFPLSTDLTYVDGVGKDEVIKRINLSGETIQIDGGKLHLSAQTRLDNAIITTAAIRDAAITSAKIYSLDAAKITTGVLSANRIGAGSITADKLAANAIQVGLAGWNNSIRISPYAIEWWDGNKLQGKINASGMHFYHGTTYLGWMGQAGFKNKPDNVRGLNTHLADGASYAAWTTGAGTDNHLVVVGGVG